MSAFRGKGEAVGGARIRYCFGGVCERAIVRGDAYHGELVSKGVAVVEVPLYAFTSPDLELAVPRYGPPRAALKSEPLDSVICREAEFACFVKPDLPKSPSGFGYEGTLTTQASVRITKPLDPAQ